MPARLPVHLKQHMFCWGPGQARSMCKVLAGCGPHRTRQFQVPIFWLVLQSVSCAYDQAKLYLHAFVTLPALTYMSSSKASRCKLLLSKSLDKPCYITVTATVTATAAASVTCTLSCQTGPPSHPQTCSDPTLSSAPDPTLPCSLSCSPAQFKCSRVLTA